MLVVTTIFIASATGALQRHNIEFSVASIDSSGQGREVGASTWTSFIGERGQRHITWIYASVDKSSSWRRDWTYDADGTLTYQSHEVAFGDLKTRWFLSRSKQGWELTGRPPEHCPKPNVRFHDETVFWFRTKQVKPGVRCNLALLDESTFKLRSGTAEYRREQIIPLGNRSVKTKLLEKKFADGTEVHYIDESGAPVRIDLVFPSSGVNLVFSAR